MTNQAPLTKQDYLGQYHIEWLKVGNLTHPVDTGQVAYQRNTGKNGKEPRAVRTRYKKLGDFDPKLLRFREVSRRADGTLACMDGNGSNHWVQEMFGPDALVPCKVYEGLTQAQEATMFLGFQRMKLVTKTEQYNAGAIAGEHTIMLLQSIAAEYGFDMSAARKPNCVPPFSAEQILKAYGEGTVRRVLRFAKTHYEGDAKQTTGSFLQGLAAVLVNSDIDEDTLVLALKSQGVSIADLLDHRVGFAAVKTVSENLRLWYDRFREGYAPAEATTPVFRQA
jgi:hypothetical protein